MLVARLLPRRCVLIAAALLIGASGATPARAQTNDGSLDASVYDRAAFDPYAVFSKVARQADGKVIVAGDFTGADGVALNGLARFNADGTLDRTFDAGVDKASGVRALLVQPDGKIVIGGLFTAVHGARRVGVARLNGDGSLDTGFDPGAQATYYVNSMALLADGRIVIGGIRDVTGAGSYRNLVARLNANGSVDTSFTSGNTEYNEGITTLTVQGDGKVLVAGTFTQFNGQARRSLARLNADGSLDTGFSLGSGGTDYQIYGIAVQPGGKIVIGGDFSVVSGVPEQRLARLNADGSVDVSFVSGADGSVTKVALQADGKIVVGGFFASVGLNGSFEQHSIARLNADGSPDPGFHVDIPLGAGGAPVNDFLLLPDANRILIAGGFNDISHDDDYTETNGLALLITGAFSAPFFNGEVPLGQSVYYLYLPNGNRFGYYSYLSDRHYVYHFDLGYEYVFDAADGQGGVYLYDFKSNGFFYTSQTFPFPYLYDFSLNSAVYYYPDPSDETHYNTGGVRYFYVFNTGQIISK